MNISDAQYNKNLQGKTICVKATIDGKTWFVPCVESNTHYAEILRQVKEEGLTIKDAE